MINYDKKFNALINRDVRNFNAKVRRLEQQGLKYLPSKVSVAELKSTYFERDDLKRRLKQLEAFSEKGAEEIITLEGGAKATKWEVKTLLSDMRYMKQYYSRRIDTYGNTIPTVLGVKQDVSYAKMGDAKYENLKVLRKSVEKDITKLEQADYNKVRRSVASQIRRKNQQKYVFWANYFTFLDDVGYKADIDPELIERIKAKLSSIDIDEFMKLYEKEEAVLDLIDYYNIQKIRAGGYKKKDKDGNGVDEVENIKRIFETLDRLIDDDSNVRFDLLQ